MKERVEQVLRDAGLRFHVVERSGGRVPVVTAEHNMTRASAMHARRDVADAVRALEDAGLEAIDCGLTIYVRAR